MIRRLFSSFAIGSIAGIPIRVHVLLVVLVLWFAFESSLDTFGILTLVALFPILLLHELGHCLVARRFGIGVIDITLWPLGGIARMTQIPESGRAEAWIAAAGPAVNFVLAALIAPVALLLSVLGADDQIVKFAVLLIVMNASLAVFNLLPAFPTDGGRILRAYFSRNADWLSATRRAVIVGRVFAVLIGVGGLALGNWLSPIVAAWLWWMGSIELAQVRERHRVNSTQVEEPLAPPASVAEVLHPTMRDPDHVPLRRAPLTDEDIDRLERFRGRLRGYDNA